MLDQPALTSGRLVQFLKDFLVNPVPESRHRRKIGGTQDTDVFGQLERVTLIVTNFIAEDDTSRGVDLLE